MSVVQNVKKPLLEVKNLAVSYGAIEALHNVSLDVCEGEIVTLLGANGAGKSTTLRCISGLVRADRGEVFWRGGPERDLTKNAEAHEIVKMGIAHSPEGRRIFGNLTVGENLQMGAFTRSSKTEADKKSIQGDFEYCFNLFPRLKERLGQAAGTLSGGEQQMLAISRALMQRPKLLMLDEPSLGIAPVLVEAIFRALVDINKRGTTLLIVEQNASAALSIASRAFVLEVGRSTLNGSAKELSNDPRIIEAYLGH